MNSIPSVDLLLPQAPPFIMVGNLLYADDKMARTSFVVDDNNLFTEAGFFREAGLLENIAQTAAAGAGYTAQRRNEPIAVGYIGAVRNFEVLALPKTGDEIITEARILDRVMNAIIVDATIHCGNRLIARCEMRVFVEAAG